jgi:glycosyltransferase involved in cell wall biosynthesis
VDYLERRSVREGVVLVVPKAGSGVAEHFAHTFRLADHVKRYVRTAVIVERRVGGKPTADRSVDVRVQRYADAGLVPRILELLWLTAMLRRRGFRSFFVRTSQTAAVPITILRRMFGGRVFYWSCGELQKRCLRNLDLRTALRSEIPLRLAFRWADAVVTGTDSLADHYSRTYGIPRERLAVLPNEIDLEWFAAASNEERRQARSRFGLAECELLVLSLHRLSPLRKTGLYIPSVLEAVADRHPSVHYVVAGGGPEEPALRDAVAQSRIAERVHLLGSIPHNHVRQLYAAADVFMMPSYTEGFPRVLLEAMAMRVPIASTDVGGVREILPSMYNRRLANRDRPLELAAAIDELLSDRNLARVLADEGARHVRQFDARSVAGRLAALMIPD